MESPSVAWESQTTCRNQKIMICNITIIIISSRSISSSSSSSSDSSSDSGSSSSSSSSSKEISPTLPCSPAAETALRPVWKLIFLCWAVPFIPMPMPKPVCRTKLYNKIVQLEVCRTFSGRGMGINGTAHMCTIFRRNILQTTVSNHRYFSSAMSLPSVDPPARSAMKNIVRARLTTTKLCMNDKPSFCQWRFST